MAKIPDPKQLVDSVADGAVELAQGPVRVADNVAKVAQTYASEVKGNMDELKKRMPDDPSVIPDVAIKTAALTVKAGIGMVEGIGDGLMETLRGVKGQIDRVL